MASTQEDGLHEIQLSGKQLVFWAMAVVVIGVVVFLLGVQVGRGVLEQRGLPEGTDVVAAAEAEPPPPPPSVAQGSGTPITAAEKLSYAERLGSTEPTAEPLNAMPAPKLERPAPKRDAVEPARAPVADSSSPVATPKVAPAVKPNSTPDSAAFSIQVAALRERDEADTIVKRLAGKGYPAYVMTPTKEAPSLYRVRVGKYKDRREADTVAAKLQKEEQFKPWVVR